jgi:hypothetical protein
MTEETPRRRKHLMVPGEPRPAASQGMSITTVQRWVMSSLAFLTIEHLSAGIVVAAVFTDPSRPGTRIGLLVVAAGFGTVAVVASLLIHQRHPLSWWLLLGLLPSMVGAYVCFAT